MAIKWSKKINDCLYEVRTAGATRRLYTNNVFHSQYNPNKVIQGGVWDLLALPAFSYPSNKIQRILVLGVGGGAVIQQLQRYLNPEKIIGIELNPLHLFVAKKYFGVKHPSIHLIEDDAIQWLENYKGEKFDLIIDDLFGHHNGEAERAVKINKKWSGILLHSLEEDGLLIINFGSNNELKNSALLAYKKLSNQFKSIFRLTLAQYDNAIGIFSKKNINTKIMQSNFESITGIKQQSLKKKINYRVKLFK